MSGIKASVGTHELGAADGSEFRGEGSASQPGNSAHGSCQWSMGREQSEPLNEGRGARGQREKEHRGGGSHIRGPQASGLHIVNMPLHLVPQRFT